MRSSKRTARVLGMLVALAGLCASCTIASGGTRPASPARAHMGGTLHLATQQTTGLGLDPQREYEGRSWELFRCCLLRTLLSVNGLDPARGGTALHPDLAASMPVVSADGLRWTFHLQRGLYYAPPLQDVPIVSRDIVRALERTARPGIGAYAFYFSVIEGFDRYAGGRADSISGLQTPDDSTLVVELRRPDGDLGYRLTTPAAAPIPPRPGHPEATFGVAEGHDKGYGPFLVASGPYMLAGSDALDFSRTADEQRPAAGFVPGSSLRLVRNPSWERRTDRLRPALVDAIDVSIGTPQAEIERGLRSGALDVDIDAVSASRGQVRAFRDDPGLRRHVYTWPFGGMRYLPLNLAVPPLDDVHVRKAVLWAVDRQALARDSLRLSLGRGLPRTTGGSFSHLFPDALESGLLSSYDPYGGVGRRRALAAARHQMSASRYDGDRDGRCDASVCARVPVLELASPSSDALLADLRDGLRRIGITLRSTSVGDFQRFVEMVTSADLGFGLAVYLSWLSDFPNASTFALPLFGGPTDGFNRDLSMVGATSHQLRMWGYDVTHVASVDDRIGECGPMVGAPQVRCWTLLDRYLMERVVPWIPYFRDTIVTVTSERVGGVSLDGFVNEGASLDHLFVTGAAPLSPGS